MRRALLPCLRDHARIGRVLSSLCLGAARPRGREARTLRGPV